MKFKIGDRVRIIENSNSSCNEVGSEGTITNFNTSNTKCRIFGDIAKRDIGNWSYIEEIELINPDMSYEIY